MKPYIYDAQDQMSPVYCISCRAHIPRAVSNAQAGLCHACNPHRAQAIPTPPPQIASPGIPSAPTPPTFWQWLFVPFAGIKYQAELGAYLNATGQVSSQAKKTMNAVVLVIGVCIILIVVTSTFSILRIFTGHDPEVQKVRAQMERIRLQAEEEAKQLRADQKKQDEEYRNYRAEEELRQAREAEEHRRFQEGVNERIQRRQREMMEDMRNSRGFLPSDVVQDPG